MKKLFLFTAGVALLGTLAGCGNSGLEQKLSKLERRVEMLENNGNEPASQAAPNPITAAQPEVPEGPVATFNFAETAHDFGTIQEGTVAEHVFKFTNNGEVPLIISNAQGSCGCTVPQYPKEPIAPGATGEILVSFNSQGRTGNQQKFVSLTANTNPSITRLSISSFVEKTGSAE